MHGAEALAIDTGEDTIQFHVDYVFFGLFVHFRSSLSEYWCSRIFKNSDKNKGNLNAPLSSPVIQNSFLERCKSREFVVGICSIGS